MAARFRANLLTMLSVTLFVTGGTLGLCVYLNMKQQLVSSAPPENILVLVKASASENTSRLQPEVARNLAVLDGVKKIDNQPAVARELVAMIAVNLDFSQFQRSVAIRGIDERSPAIHGAKITQGAMPEAGSLQVIVGRRIARKYPHLKVGGSIHMPGGECPIVGIFEADGAPFEDEIWTERPALELHLKVKFSSSVTVVAASEAEVPSLVQRINTTKQLDARATPVAEFRKTGAGLDTILRLVLVLLILLSVVATSAIATTMSAAVLLRMPEFAALVAIGIRRGVLARLVILESTLVALLGAIIGVVLSELLRRQIGILELGDMPVELVNLPIVPVVGAVLGAAVGVIGGLAPSLAVKKLDVITSLR